MFTFTMMCISDTEWGGVGFQSQMWQLRDALTSTDSLPALLELPLALEQGTAESTHTTIEEDEEETDQNSGLDEDLHRLDEP